MKIPFNKPYLTGKETEYIKEAADSLQLSGNGKYTKLCHRFFEEKYEIQKCLLTTSCTDALEMAAILSNIQPGDEVIMPSFTFVSTANAFVLRGANIVFCDSRADHPGMDEDLLEDLITDKTKVIVPVHYAGVACDMDKIMDIAAANDIYVVEDAAQAVDSFYTGRDGRKRPLGSIGHLAAFSFHETKNIISGEGGMLAINHPEFVERAEIIWEKGTNRSAFFRGEVDKYGWMDIGSSFLPSEIIAAFLWAQLEELRDIQNRRVQIWNSYHHSLRESPDGQYKTPIIPSYATNNGHMYYLVFSSLNERSAFIEHLRSQKIHAVFHYQSLHKSPFYSDRNNQVLEHADRYSNCLLRLPFYYSLDNQVIIDACLEYATLSK